MAKDKNKIIVYADWINRFEALTDEEAGRLIKHFFRYVNDLDPEYPDRITELSFIDIKCTLKRDLKEWEKFRERQSINGSKGGRPKKPTETQKTQPFILKPKKAVSVTVSVNDIHNIEARKTKFKKLLSPFQDKYSIELLKDFYQYWTEHGEKDKKVRFEKEKSFSVERRLSTWKKKEAQFNNKPKGRDLGNGFGTYIKSS